MQKNRSFTFYLFLFVACCAMGCASVSSVSSKDAVKSVDRGLSDKVWLLLDMANAALDEKDPISALQYLEGALKENQKIPEIFHAQALAFYQKKDFQASEKAAREALVLSPQYSEAKITLGRVLAEQGKGEDAIPILQQAAEDILNRHAYKAWTNLGWILLEKKDKSKAEEYFRKAIREAPQEACVAYAFLADLKMEKSQFKEAIQQYQKATQEGCSHFTQAQFSLGLAYEKNHQYDLARRTFLEIQKKYPRTEFSQKALEHLQRLP